MPDARDLFPSLIAHQGRSIQDAMKLATQLVATISQIENPRLLMEQQRHARDMRLRCGLETILKSVRLLYQFQHHQNMRIPLKALEDNLEHLLDEFPTGEP